MTMNASEMGRKSFKVRVKKYGKDYLYKHAELMRNAKKAKRTLKIKENIG